jgi:hypothetical protein
MGAYIRRVAAKPYRCIGCDALIGKGDVHLRVTVFPNNIFDRVLAGRQCARCTIAAHRDDKLGDIPYAQCARDGLL